MHPLRQKMNDHTLNYKPIFFGAFKLHIFDFKTIAQVNKKLDLFILVFMNLNLQTTSLVKAYIRRAVATGC